eukprot:SAG31_NODE_2345_length_5903_cov_1.552895_3_plen_87_part_00
MAGVARCARRELDPAEATIRISRVLPFLQAQYPDSFVVVLAFKIMLSFGQLVTLRFPRYVRATDDVGQTSGTGVTTTTSAIMGFAT